jgi:hypothetical protein
MTNFSSSIAKNLRKSRKKYYPNDRISDFAIRCEIALSTYKKMEKGDLSVGMIQYVKAAKILSQEARFDQLFEIEEDWFNE